MAMPRAEQREIRMRIVIGQPVAGVLHSLQDKKSAPVDARRSEAGEAIAFDFPVRIAPGPKFYGEQVRSEGPERRFVYIAVGKQAGIAVGKQAGDCASEWSRRMKIDIHDIAPRLLEAAVQGGVLETTIGGTAEDGTPTCATVRPIEWRLVSG